MNSLSAFPSVGARFRQSSQRLINRYGKSRVYVSKSEPYYDFETQQVTGGETLYTVKMFKADIKERESRQPNLVNRVVVVMMIAAADLPIKPKIGDLIYDQILGVDEAYEVLDIKVNESAEEIASWRLYCAAT